MSKRIALLTILILALAVPGWGANYILHDTFTDTHLDGTGKDDTGNYTRGVLDSESKLSISNNILTCTGGKASPGWGNPRVVYSPGITRVAGKASRFRINPTIANGSNLMAGWANSATPTVAFPSGQITYGGDNSSGGPLGSLTYYSNQVVSTGWRIPNSYQQYMVVQQTTGAYLLGYGGSFAKPCLVMVDKNDTWTPLYPTISNYSLPFTCSDFAVLDLNQFADLDWTSAHGLATNYIASPVSGTTTTMVSDALVEVTWTPATSDVLELSFRRGADDNNRWLVRCDQAAGTIKLFKKIGGVETEFNPGITQGWTASTAYRILVIADSDNIAVYAGTSTGNLNLKLATVMTVNIYDASLITNTGAGVNLTGTGTITQLITWPRYPAMSLNAWLTEPSFDNIVFSGDSQLVIGTFTGPDVRLGLPSYSRGSFYAIAGSKVTTGQSPYVTSLEADQGGSIDSVFSSKYNKNWCIVWAGTNDAWGSPLPTAATTYAALMAFCKARMAAGYRVIVCTMVSRGLHTDGGWADHDQWRIDYNTLIRNNYRSWGNIALADTDAYAAANWGAYPAENLTYYNADRTHMNATGGTAMANIIIAAMGGYHPWGGGGLGMGLGLSGGNKGWR